MPVRNDFEGKTILVAGAISKSSMASKIAWNVARRGAKHVILSSQTQEISEKLRRFAEDINVHRLVFDVTDEESLERAFEKLNAWGSIDAIVHSIAYTDRDQLRGKYTEVTRRNFLKTLEVSAYSLIILAQWAKALMHNGGVLLTLTYQGARVIIPNYHMMGVAKAALERSVLELADDLGENDIRVLGVSANPLPTLSGRAVPDSRKIEKQSIKYSMLGRLTTPEEVAQFSATLLLSTGITGSIFDADAGISGVGMRFSE